MKGSLLAVALTIALVSCQSQGQSYDDPRQVVAAMADANVDCEELVRATPSSLPGDRYDALVEERGSCRVGAHRVVITTFENAEDRGDWVAVGKLLGPLVAGPNWAVTSRSEAIVNDIAEALDAAQA